MNGHEQEMVDVLLEVAEEQEDTFSQMERLREEMKKKEFQKQLAKINESTESMNIQEAVKGAYIVE